MFNNMFFSACIGIVLWMYVIGNSDFHYYSILLEQESALNTTTGE